MANVKREAFMLPAVLVKGNIIFPKTVVSIEINDINSLKAVKYAMETKKRILVVTQLDPSAIHSTGDISTANLCECGVVAEIKQCAVFGGTAQIIVSTLHKAELIKYIFNYPVTAFIVKRRKAPRVKTDTLKMKALIRCAQDACIAFTTIFPRVPIGYAESIRTKNDPYELLVYISDFCVTRMEDKKKLFDIDDIAEQLRTLIDILQEEMEILGLEREVLSKTRDSIESHNREAFLREQLKVIKQELSDGTGETEGEGYESYPRRIERIENLEEQHKNLLLKESERLSEMHSASHEALIIQNYLDTVLELPWDNATKDEINLSDARKALDKDHHGLEDVKERILETLAVYKIKGSVKGQIICLAGPPGVGKTSIAQAIAGALGRNFQRISLGGVSDESEIRGHRRTYIGALPGRIINALKMAESRNPVILLDEIDKMGKSLHGDPGAALLEVLDSEQNAKFVDRYLNIPFDLSDVLFITTANTLQNISRPLYDRMEVIELTSYTREEKFAICKKHLIKKQLKKHGLTASRVKINDKVIYTLIDNYTKESGVRRLERHIASLCRKAAKKLADPNTQTISFTSKNLEEYIGVKKYKREDGSGKDEVGVVNGLAYTTVGGETMQIEVSVLKGTGKLELTGSLGDVMKESAKTAVSYVRNLAPSYGISSDFYKDSDIHIHVPEGATPKDGPSAGIALTVALISALSDIPVRHDVAMTGEVTLRGRVLAIGGLKEKTMAAYRAGIGNVIIPAGNRADLRDIDKTVTAGLNFITADSIKDVLDNSLVRL
ncbi:MAG: endopeptidase La [Oscillospiraceae bacterium]|nr:endopeptidase La [Oscillospiraceae bacterium]